MKIFTASKETGDFIEEVKTIEEGIELIKKYEADDRTNEIFEEDFYNLVNENHESLLNKEV